MTKIPVLSFFTGGGFLDMGFEMAGFDIVWSNEYDKIFAELHSSGMTSWRKSKGNGIKAEIFNTKSIHEISSEEIVKEAFHKIKPNVFGVIGGPPCQDFSLNGKQKGFIGERGKLTVTFFNKIIDLQPTFFVMENVTGLIKVKSNREYLSSLLKTIESDYIIDYSTLNSLNFGVPQFRERVFFIGIRKNFIKESYKYQNSLNNWFPWPMNSKYFNAANKFKWPKIEEIGTTVIVPNGIPSELFVASVLISSNEFSKYSNSDEYFRLVKPISEISEIKEGETTRPSFKRLHRYRYSPTTCYGNNEVHLHPFENRRISVREALRIQGVPDTYSLPSELSLSKKFKMIGNGVPVPLAKAVAESVKKFLLTCK